VSQTTAEPLHLDDGPQYLPHNEILPIMFAIMAGTFLAALDQSIVGVALPRITSELGGLEHLSWVVTAYLLTSTAVTPLWGKISDLYGRKRIYQSAIVIFLLGSMLCGLAQDMPQLIAFRAIQGIGGGGLMAIGLAIIGDIIPPRDRGRYQGFFGAVFGVSAVAGPLIGGWLTDAISWRWIFYINLPVGAVAVFLIATRLNLRTVRRDHAIDYLGAGLVVSSVSSLLLYLNYSGENWGWTDARSLALLAAAIVLAIAFVIVEMRAVEPILPMRLFRNDIFSISNAFGFISGLAMFGGIIFLPLYFQGTLGMSPTRSGMAMLPMVVGIFSFSITTGLLITKTGKYKIFPIAGSVLIGIGLVLLSRLQVDTSYWFIAVAAYIFGAGLGLTMQPMMVATQNAVPFRDMGVATSSVTFTRSLGSAIGTAIFGAILNSRLSMHLEDGFAALGGGGNAPQIQASAEATNNIQAMQDLEEPVRGVVLGAYTDAITDLFIVALPFVIVGLVIALFLREIPLKTGGSSQNAAAGEEANAPEPIVVAH
jgi:EmrB/QacA subfamily drug resistance transporter